MATSPEDVKKNEDEFKAGFDDNTPPKPEQSEDEAFGLGMDVEEAAAVDGEQSSGDGAPIAEVVIVADGADAGESGEGGAAGGMAADVDAGVSSDAVVDDEPTDPKDIQRKKSWEGRLKAEEGRLAKVREELEAKAAAAGKAPEAAASDALEEVADKAEDDGDVTMAAKVDEAAEKVESGEMSVDEAMKSLSEDFGEPFVKMIAAIAKSAASAAAGEKIGELESATSAIIDDIKETKTRSHFQAIEAAHPDFVEIGRTPEFEAWKAEDPERERIASGGTAAEINAMLTEWKSVGAAGGATEGVAQDPAMAAAPAGGSAEAVAADDSAPEDELDAAEGVRSAGMQLPEEPAAADDYAGAWEEFAAKDRPRA